MICLGDREALEYCLFGENAKNYVMRTIQPVQAEQFGITAQGSRAAFSIRWFVCYRPDSYRGRTE